MRDAISSKVRFHHLLTRCRWLRMVSEFFISNNWANKYVKILCNYDWNPFCILQYYAYICNCNNRTYDTFINTKLISKQTSRSFSIFKKCNFDTTFAHRVYVANVCVLLLAHLLKYLFQVMWIIQQLLSPFVVAWQQRVMAKLCILISVLLICVVFVNGQTTGTKLILFSRYSSLYLLQLENWMHNGRINANIMAYRSLLTFFNEIKSTSWYIGLQSIC